VWISQTLAPMRAAASTWATSASMKTLTMMPWSARRATASFRLRLLGDDVEAALGGHLVAAFGHEHRHLGLDLAGDADHLVGGGHLEVELDLGESRSLRTSASWMWRRSSRRCTVMPSAPPRWASTAAHTGSGSQVRRAWRRVATWSILTPSSIKTDLRERQTVR
jgi:hypothetical protein